MTNVGQKILVVDDKPMMRDSVGAMLQRAGWMVIAAGDGASAIRQHAKHQPVAVITDLKMPEMDGLQLLSRLREIDRDLPVVLMTAYGSIETAVEAMREGAFDFIQKPFDGKQLISVINRAVETCRTRRRRGGDDEAPAGEPVFPSLIGRSPVMRELGAQIQKIAQSHGTVLIQGESGTGKEVVARTLHAMGPRRDRVMLCLNCAALSGALLESELFGHERGAFTGADSQRKGRFELADRGTLLLDEISEIDPALQAKLLRVLQENQFERVGSSSTIHVDVRVIATTNRDLTESVAAGQFRQDLFYRLNVLPLVLPPLRQRLEDIPQLSEHFFDRTALRDGAEPKRLTPEALDLMMQYHWPGNVRELQNICERAHIMTRDSAIGPETIRSWLQWDQPSAVQAGRALVREPAMIRGGWSTALGAMREQVLPGRASPDAMHPQAPAANAGAPALPDDEMTTLEQTERSKILRTLERFGGNRRRTAEALGIGLRTLGLKLKKWKEARLVDAAV
ncbi:MAG: sigma-54-dependent Fis family transcriptional regulator [Phycisphaeraceae bacterium]|nr:sigma-54-dependent Fis family transcriptional regulator [Phycisphaeraceae bacterium]